MKYTEEAKLLRIDKRECKRCGIREAYLYLTWCEQCIWRSVELDQMVYENEYCLKLSSLRDWR